MILEGNCIDWLKQINDESIDCVVTSPPYWALRDYKVSPHIWDDENDPNCEHEWNETKARLAHQNRNNSSGSNTVVFANPKRANSDHRVGISGFCSKCNAWKGAFGLEPTFQLYIKHMLDIFIEIKRILKKTGTCWVVLGDTYGTHNSGGKGYKHNFYSVQDVEDSGLAQKKPKGLEKSLIMIPQRFAIGMVDRGWILRNDIIWHKPNCMPSSATDRFTVDYEHIFFFTKSQRYYFSTQYEPMKSESIERIAQGFETYNTKYDKVFPDTAVGNLRNGSNPSITPDSRIKRTVWKIPTQPFPDAHFAVFPEELVKTPIIAGCPEGGIVLDPFAGSGTTLLAAHKLFRNWLGIEINPEYIKIAKDRLTPHLQEQKITAFV
jgi:site-specific DNA-methyltransferase (adenine-specific)